jgi:hypothetical protein
LLYSPQNFIALKLNHIGNIADGFFKLPYRVVFAVATMNSVYVYDTESIPPILIHAGLHYAAITDIACVKVKQICGRQCLFRRLPMIYILMISLVYFSCVKTIPSEVGLTSIPKK